MTSYLEYGLVNGYVHNWLVAGPRALSIQNMESFPGDEESKRRQIYQSLLGTYRSQTLDITPVEWDEFEVGDTLLKWKYLRCQDDHLVDLSASVPLWHQVSAWAYTGLFLPSAQTATFVLTTPGPVEVWLNGKQIYCYEDFHLSNRVGISFPVELAEGENRVCVRFEMVGVRACPLTLALQVKELPEDIEKAVAVKLATLARYPRRHETLEETFERAYLEEVVNHRGAHFNLHWAKSDGPKMRYAYQIQDQEGFVYVEGTWETDEEKPVDVGHGFRLNEKPFFVALRPIILEYFEHNLRYEKKLPLYVIDNEYTSIPAHTFAERNREALEDAAKYSSNLYAEIAKLALGRWSDFQPDVVLGEVQKINRREAGSQISLLGLLGIAYRYMNDPKFPLQLKNPIEECVLNFRYWSDEGPTEAQNADGLVFHTESDSLIFHACETLAGQLYPQHTFPNTGQQGEWLRSKGEQLALKWLRLRGANGFQEWDSNDTFEKMLLALSHLTSLAKESSLSELSAVMMDKIFFSMAVNSFKGAFGSSRGRANASMLKSAQLEATSGISRMMWGMGVYNSHILGTVSLAASTYEFPLLIGDIANDVTSVVWNQERHVVDYETGSEVNKVTYKTPDYMLCSAQDYRPGEPGSDEHIWQATMGSDAVVFGNHPANLSSSPDQRPGFWLGNCSLPRVAQWKDVLVAVHHLADEDWLGFTHVYFPTFKFSEYEITTDKNTGLTWAFARKGDGYLALTAQNGFELIQRAPDGYRELRSYGQNNIWLCQMGRAETDGNFERFKKRVLSMKVEFQTMGVRCKTLRGEYLSFGWEGPLLVNSKEKPLRGYKHHQSPYSTTDLPATQMDIQYKDTIMRLDFS